MVDDDGWTTEPAYSSPMTYEPKGSSELIDQTRFELSLRPSLKSRTKKD